MKDDGGTQAACNSGRATANSPIPPCLSKACSSAAWSSMNMPTSSPPPVQGIRVRFLSSNFPDCIAAKRARPISKARLGGVCGSPLSHFKGKCSLLPSEPSASCPVRVTLHTQHKKAVNYCLPNFDSPEPVSSDGGRER